MTREDDVDNDEDYCTDAAFMFEGSETSTLKYYKFNIANDDGCNRINESSIERKKTIKIALNVVDDEPGALQSGHYLWPAAPSLVRYLLTLSLSSVWRPQSVLELGTGCGLCSLASLQIYPTSIEYIVMTNHDPQTLERAEGNYKATQKYLEKDNITSSVKSTLDPSTSQPEIRWEILTWGNEVEISRVLSDLQEQKRIDGFDLILGSDLIYDISCVQPLFKSVSRLLGKRDKSKLFLSQSFKYDHRTEQEISKVCSKFGINQSVIIQKNFFDAKRTCRQDLSTKIQEYVWK